MGTIDRLDEAAVLTSSSRFFRNMAKEGTSFATLIATSDDRTKRRNLARFIAAGCPEITLPNDVAVQKSAHPYDADMTLGRDFISPEEIIARYPALAYTKEQIGALKTSFPSLEELEWLRHNDFILVPGPPTAMSLLDIRTLDNSYFENKRGDLLNNGSRQRLWLNDKVQAQWIALRKTAVPDSFSKQWLDQQSLVSDGEVVPNIAEAVWGIMMYKRARNINLFRSTSVRTSSLVSVDVPIHVGPFDSDTLVISYLADAPVSCMGLASIRKFPVSQEK